MANGILNSALVFLGSALGAVMRHWLSGIVARRIGESFPFGTIAVNLSGCFVIGLLAGAVHDPSAFAEGGLVFFTFGVLGGYTTVSSFTLQTMELFRQGRNRRGTLNLLISTAGCLAGVALGMRAGGMLGSIS